MFSQAIFQMRMNNIKFFIALNCIFLLLVISACSQKDAQLIQVSKSKNSCKYSKWLQIYEGDKSIEIKIIHPDHPERIYSFSCIKIASKNLSQSKEYILIPCKNIAALSATHIGMLSVLGAENTICAVSDSKLVYNPSVKDGLQSGSILSLGESQEISMEALLSSGAKTIVHSAFSGDFPHREQLKKMGLTCIPNFDWREEDPLGKAEWLLLFGYLTGKEEQAKTIISEITQSYNQTLKKVKNQSKEKVIFGNFIRDYWYAPAGESYNAQLIQDAGMNYIYRKTKGTGSVTIPMENILMETKDVKYWINPGFSTKAEIVKSNPKVKNLNCYNNGKIYCYSHDVNKFWELSAVQPHLVLADLYSIISVNSPKNLQFYKQLR